MIRDMTPPHLHYGGTLLEMEYIVLAPVTSRDFLFRRVTCHALTLTVGV
jgi:hypothetical protein